MAIRGGVRKQKEKAAMVIVLWPIYGLAACRGLGCVWYDTINTFENFQLFTVLSALQ